jgi:hypothetical protein
MRYFRNKEGESFALSCLDEKYWQNAHLYCLYEWGDWVSLGVVNTRMIKNLNIEISEAEMVLALVLMGKRTIYDWLTQLYEDRKR